jgi:Cdc6-like AAA superfamily ATPase
MSDLLSDIYNACDPFLPASEQYYYDCRDARGGDAFIKNVFNHLKRANPDKEENRQNKRYRHFLFSGHIGSGKSSELKHLVDRLKESNQHNVTFFPVYIDTFDYLDVYDVSITDILLSVVTELSETLREELGIELKDTYFRKRFEEIKEYALGKYEINEGELDLGVGKIKIQRLKQDPNARRIVRDALKTRIPTILEEINLLFEQARLEVRKKTVGEHSLKYSDIVIIIDNLEKIQKLEETEDGIESYQKLFIDYYPQLTGLQSHIIFTVPLRLVRSAIAPKLREYYSEPFVLPMIKIFHRESRKPFAKGIESLKKILQKRLEKVKLDDAFEPDALDFLIKYSGGSIRYLMSFVREATTYTDNLPLTLAEAKNAVKQTIQTFSTSIPDKHWKLLAELDIDPNQDFPNDDEDYRKMLENLSVLEYINGGDEDIWEEVAPWYAVHPIVRQLRQFKNARDLLLEEQKKTEEKPEPGEG